MPFESFLLDAMVVESKKGWSEFQRLSLLPYPPGVSMSIYLPRSASSMHAKRVWSR